MLFPKRERHYYQLQAPLTSLIDIVFLLLVAGFLLGRPGHEALVPGGRLVLIEYRAEDPRVPIKRLHKMTEAQAKREMLAAGLIWEQTLQVLPTQHLMVFRKP